MSVSTNWCTLDRMREYEWEGRVSQRFVELKEQWLKLSSHPFYRPNRLEKSPSHPIARRRNRTTHQPAVRHGPRRPPSQSPHVHRMALAMAALVQHCRPRVRHHNGKLHQSWISLGQPYTLLYTYSYPPKYDVLHLCGFNVERIWRF